VNQNMQSPDPIQKGWLYRLASPRLPAALRGVAAASIALLAGYQLAGQITGATMARSETPAQTIPQTATEASPVTETTDPFETLLLDVQPGDTLDGLFRASGLNLVDLAEIMRLDAARQNLRILRPGDTLSVRHDAGTVLEIERDVGIGQTFVVQRNDATSDADQGSTGPIFRAELVNLPLERRVVTAGGHISTSLFEAAADAGISERAVMKLADIFAWDIDFVRDINSGDEFSLVYEELWRNGKKLGEGDILAAEFTNRGGRYTAIRFEEADGRTAYYSTDGRPMRKAFVRVPVSFTRISSKFNPNRRHPILNTIRAHQGVDYAARTGTPVHASGDGKVIFRGWKSGYGNTLILQHGGNITTLYAHLSRFAKTSSYGSKVRQGEVIAYVGATGLATAAHLHYEYRKNGVHLNPQTVILPPAEPLRGTELMAFQTTAQPLLARISTRQTALAANRTATN
jgi:murein DD-endopeptidase MepM/ murein hydrolase activator NlpD